MGDANKRKEKEKKGGREAGREGKRHWVDLNLWMWGINLSLHVDLYNENGAAQLLTQ